MADLVKQEADLLAELSQWESEASRSRLALDKAQEELTAIKMDLNSIRNQLLVEFLNARFSPKMLVYTLRTEPETGEVFANVIASPGGELEFDKFASKLGWEDTDNIPLDYLINYFGEGLPWNSQSSTDYV